MAVTLRTFHAQVSEISTTYSETFNISRVWIICSQMGLLNFTWPTSNSTPIMTNYYKTRGILRKCYFRVAVAEVIAVIVLHHRMTNKLKLVVYMLSHV